MLVNSSIMTFVEAKKIINAPGCNIYFFNFSPTAFITYTIIYFDFNKFLNPLFWFSIIIRTENTKKRLLSYCLECDTILCSSSALHFFYHHD